MTRLPQGKPISRAALAAGWVFSLAVLPAALGQETSPAPPTDIPGLVAQLGDADYHTREAAEAKLSELGYAAYEALAAAEQDADPEIAARARYLLRQITVDWIRADDPEDVRRLFDGYDELSLDERFKRADQLFRLPADQGLSGLCRIVRFDRSELLAKRAALFVCSRMPANEPRAQQIRRDVGKAARPAARWLEAYCLEASDLKLAAAQWGEVAAAERRAGELRPEIAPAEMQDWLDRRQASVWRRAGRPEQAREVIARIIAREPGDPESMERLVDWLVSEEAWQSIDDVATRFAPFFQADPILTYSLAQARVVQGRTEEAEKLAAQAVAMRPGQLDLHGETAGRLHRRGQTRWAENEYRLVIEQAQAGSSLALAAQRRLAEMLYDTLDFGRAADVLDASVSAMRENVRQRREAENGGSIEETLGRALYMRAEQKREQSDTASRRELLEQALEQNPLDVDVLIALSNTPDLSPEMRAGVAQRVEQAAQSFRAEMSQSPHDGTPFNQLAWLLANTGGDLNEALEASRESLDLQPDEPAFLDTLGRVLYARGEFAAAIEQQSRAVELTPHSGLMRRQLELFRAALDKSRDAEEAEPTTE